MQWLMLLILAFGPAMSADRIRAVARVNEAIKAEVKHDTPQAIRLAKEAIELDPSYAKSHFILGQLQRKAGQLIDAAATYRKGLELAPKDEELAVDLAYNLGLVIVTRASDPGLSVGTRTAALREAIVAFDTAIAADPGHYKAHLRRAYVHDKLEDPDAADADFRRCIRLEPRYPACFSGLAHLYIDYGFEIEAIAVIDAGLASNPKDAQMWSAAGRAHLDLGRPADAVGPYDKAKAIDPDLIDALFGLGMAHAELRNRKDAVDNLMAFIAQAGSDVSEARKKMANDTIARMQDVF